MTNTRFKSGWKDFKTALKQKWHHFTDDDLLEAEGGYEKFQDVVQKRYHDRKELVINWAHDWYSKREREEIMRKKATESPNQA